MNRGTTSPGIASRLSNGNDESNKLLMQAVMLSEGAQAELRRARQARSEAEKIRERAEVEKTHAMDEAFASVKVKAQALMDEAHVARSAAESDRLQAREDLERAESLKEETKRTCAQMEAESRERAEQILHEGRLKARATIAEMEHQAEEEMRRILSDVEALQAAAQEEMEAQRLLTSAARLRAGSPDRDLLAELGIGDGGQSNGHDVHASMPTPVAAGRSRKEKEVGLIERQPEAVAATTTPEPEELEELAEVGAVQTNGTNGHVAHASKSTKRAIRRGTGTKGKE